jgi:DNA-binding NtrC family response regulator
MIMPKNVLVVDDQDAMQEFLKGALLPDYRITPVPSPEAARKALEASAFDALLVDLGLPGRNDASNSRPVGDMDLLEEVRSRWPDTVPIVITAYPSLESGVESNELGACECVSKPFSKDHIRHVLGRAIEHRDLRRRVAELSTQIEAMTAPTRMIGTSPQMQELRERIERVARSEATVLLTGEPGVGKSLIARLIHEESHRGRGPWVVLNCSNFQGELLESELFGHRKGAFAGAANDKEGMFHKADGGTIFLDEIGGLSPDTQIKLLRVIQDRELQRVGDTETARVDVRIIAATHSNLLEKMREGRFREDLYYRLNVVPMNVPPLRERREDIGPLACHYLKLHAARHGRTDLKISQEALRYLESRSWPGNIRELENVIEHGVIMSRSDELKSQDLRFHARLDEAGPEMERVFREGSIREMERLMIEDRLRRIAIRNRAAETLGISVRTLRNKLHLYRRREVAAASLNP